MADQLLINVDVNSSQALTAMSALQKANVRYEASAQKAALAQARFDEALAKSGASSVEAAAAQKKLEGANLRAAASYDKLKIASARAGEVQAAASKKAAAAADASAAANKRTAGSLFQSATGFSAAQGGALAAGAAFIYAAKSAATFDSKMAQIKTLTGGSSAQVSALSNATKQYADIGVSASQAADAEIELVKAGVSVKDILSGGLSGALNLAAAGQLDVASATSIASAAMVQFGLDGKDIPHIADDLAAGANKSLGSVEDLGMGLKAVGTTAHQAGFGIDETVGALAALASAGLTAELGGTALKQMFLKLEAPSAKAKALMDQYGISLYDAAGNVKPLADIAGQLKEHLDNLTPATRNAALATIFGSRAVQAANVLYQNGAAGIQNWTDKVNDAGAAADTTKGQMDSLIGDFDKLKASLQNLAVDQGEHAQSPLRSLTQDLTNLVDVGNSSGFRTAFDGFEKVFGPSGFLSPVGPLSNAGAFKALTNFDFGGDALKQAVNQVQLFNAAAKRAPSVSAIGGGAAMAGSVDELGRSFAALPAKARAAGDGVKGFGSDADAAATAAQKAATAADKLLASMLKLDNSNLGRQGDRDNISAAIDAANKALKENGKTLDVNTEKGRANRAVLRDMASSYLTLAADYKTGSKDQVAVLEQGRTELLKQRIAFGDTRAEAEKYVNQVLRIPTDLKTKTDFDYIDAYNHAKALETKYDGLDGRDVKTITELLGSAKTIGDLQRIIGYENFLQGRVVKTYVDTVLRTVGTPGGHSVYDTGSGSLPGHASGGAIIGRGTGTSDSNLRRLSHGEHVWTARETANAGGHAGVMALRRQFQSPRGVQGLAGGGAVGGGSYRAPAGASADMTALTNEVRAMRTRLDRLHVTATVDNAGEVASGVRSVADGRVTNSSQHTQRRRKAGFRV